MRICGDVLRGLLVLGTAGQHRRDLLWVPPRLVLVWKWGRKRRAGRRRRTRVDSVERSVRAAAWKVEMWCGVLALVGVSSVPEGVSSSERKP